jgi:hypothetical protein
MRDPAHPYRLGGEHFGEQLRGPQIGHKMIRDLYTFPSRSQKRKPNRADFSDKAWEDEAWRYRDEEHTRHSDAYLLVQRDKALRNSTCPCGIPSPWTRTNSRLRWSMS